MTENEIRQVEERAVARARRDVAKQLYDELIQLRRRELGLPPKGDGVADCTAAIQAAMDKAFGCGDAADEGSRLT